MPTQKPIAMDTPVNTRKPGRTRVMVQVWDQAARNLQKTLGHLNLKRDRYLNDLFRLEIERLNEEMTFRNSDVVAAALRGQKIPNRVKLTIELDEEVKERLNAVLKAKNVPRDSFVNRVLFFLLAKRSTLEALEVYADRSNDLTARPLTDASGHLYDPFFHIREANDGRFYTLACFREWTFGEQGPNLFALNTAISEEDWRLMNLRADDLLLDLGFSVAAPGTEAP